MNRQKRRSHKKLAVAVENRNFEQNGATTQCFRRRAPRGLRDRRRDVEIFRTGESQDFRGALGGFYAHDETIICSSLRGTRREPGKIDLAAVSEVELVEPAT